MGTIRLACLLCDCDDCHEIDSVPSSWKDVDEVQSYEDSIEVNALAGHESLWWTHIGVCPACQEIRFAPADESTLA